MTGTFEWATYPRLLERNFFEWTKELYTLEKQLLTPIPDSMHWTRRFEYPWILSKITMSPPPRSFVDAGSGATALQFALTRRGDSVMAIDPDPTAVDWINTRCLCCPGIRSSSAVTGGFPVLPFKDDQFDVGICISVLEHLPKQQVLPSIRELLRVSCKEVLITMDVVLSSQHPTQMDYSDLHQILSTLGVTIPSQARDQSITFQMDGYLFGVACLHLTKD